MVVPSRDIVKKCSPIHNREKGGCQEKANSKKLGAGLYSWLFLEPMAGIIERGAQGDLTARRAY
jgi:hypothetical protein